MAATADAQGPDLFGFLPGYVVQEFGWDEDVDQALREAIEDHTGNELADEDHDEVTDGVIVWWREGDGDLVDSLVDAQTVLEDGASIWVLNVKAGRDGHISHNDIQDAANTAGMNTMSTLSVAEDWTATKVANRGRGR